MFTTSALIIINKTTRIETNLNHSQREFILNAKNISVLIKQGIKPQFDFINKKELFSCFWLNYEMSPYLSTEEFKKCVAAPINYNPENQELFQNLEHEYFEECIHNKQNCKVKYYPFNNRVEVYFD
ncbi:hypothetical protein Trichorick_01172 [Candidatus Trichorickettsia mobilis]|uniref:Uncharacterized protein n=1 Tax=Candidatus Trichorickettsia mobilis TaxID=1346319 RepID=A0ABZ0UTA6_9RICK|nr:hypothetical protein [Candidatus Trichorickettsia mobilis]WPY01264.1 hypothetical protein Trichorick_01172 [Candidatus Trichorickettsia mobilis]